MYQNKNLHGTSDQNMDENPTMQTVALPAKMTCRYLSSNSRRRNRLFMRHMLAFGCTADAVMTTTATQLLLLLLLLVSQAHTQTAILLLSAQQS